MTRILIASALTTVLVTGTAAAYQTNPPATQKPPAQTPPPTTPPQTTTPPPLVPPGQTTKPATPPPPFPAEAKIGFVSLQAVVSESKLGKAGSNQMKTLADQRNAEIGAAEKKIADLQ